MNGILRARKPRAFRCRGKSRCRWEAAASPSGNHHRGGKATLQSSGPPQIPQNQGNGEIPHFTIFETCCTGTPRVWFKLIQDQGTLWHLNPIECDGSPDSRMQALEERMQQIEKNTWQRLAVQFKDTIQTKVHQESGDHFEEENIAIWGYIGAPVSDDPHAVINGCSSSTVVRSRTRP